MNKGIIIGTGGTSKVIFDILTSSKIYLHNNLSFISYEDINTLSNINLNTHIILAIGASRNVEYRKEAFRLINKMGLNFQSVISPKSTISILSKVGRGCIIMPGVIINSDVTLKSNSFLNTGVIVEHDCKIGESSFLATGCILSGNVTIGDNTFIGAGAVISGGVTIGNNVTVGAGAVVIRDIEDNILTYGNPSHKHQKIINDN